MDFMIRQRVTRSLQITVIALFLSAIMPIFTVSAADSGGVGGKPANPREDNPRSSSIFLHELSPGQSVDDAVEVYNNTDNQKSVQVYATDSIVSSGGAFACEQAAEQADKTGAWIKLTTNFVTLDANSSQVVPFTISVPDNTEPGEHNACIAIQEANADPVQSGNGIALSFRSAIRVAITVPGDINKSLSISSVSLRTANDKLVGSIKLDNTGNVSLDTDIVAPLANAIGKYVQTQFGTYPALAHTETELNFEYNKPFWGGLYRLNATAHYNNDVSASLGKGANNQQVSATSRYLFVWPQPVAMIILLTVLLAIIGLAWYLWRRFIALPRQIKSYIDYTVQDGDDIQSIAKQTKTNWKHIARINNIKPPYTLKPGTSIKTPRRARKSAVKPKQELAEKQPLPPIKKIQTKPKKPKKVI